MKNPKLNRIERMVLCEVLGLLGDIQARKPALNEAMSRRLRRELRKARIYENTQARR